MTKVNVTAWVKVAGGPNLSTGLDIEPEAVVQSVVVLAEAGGADDEKTAELLPAAGDVTLLALSARTASGAAATITLTPRNGTEVGDAIDVPGVLVVANAGVLAALVAGGPRSLTLANNGAAPVTVTIIAARAD